MLKLHLPQLLKLHLLLRKKRKRRRKKKQRKRKLWTPLKLLNLLLRLPRAVEPRKLLQRKLRLKRNPLRKITLKSLITHLGLGLGALL